VDRVAVEVISERLGHDPAGSAAGVGEGAVLAGAVVADRVHPDELFPDADLDGVGDDGDLDLAAPVGATDPVVGAGEGHVAGRVDLAGDRRR
jgi:hypothetical protein